MDNKDFLKNTAKTAEPEVKTGENNTSADASENSKEEKKRQRPLQINLQDLFFNNFITHTFKRSGLSYTLRTLTGADSELVYACLEPAMLKNSMAVDLAVELLQVACALTEFNGKLMPVRGKDDVPSKWLLDRVSDIKEKPAILIDRIYDDFKLLTAELNFALNTPDRVGDELKN